MTKLFIAFTGINNESKQLIIDNMIITTDIDMTTLTTETLRDIEQKVAEKVGCQNIRILNFKTI